MMTDSEVEAVYIATPNNLHYENCRMCLEAGKHVLCEKPFTLSTEQAQELFDLAEEKGLFIMEAFWIRFLPAYDKLRAMLRDGVIGEVKSGSLPSLVLWQKAPGERENLSQNWAEVPYWISASIIWDFSI